MPATGSMTGSGQPTLGEKVYCDLRDLLIAGQLAPGEKLSLRALAERLEVSPMPVRDALRRLMAERAIEILPKRAVRVPLMTRERFSELRTIRIAVEGLAAGLAAERCTAAEVDAIERHHDVFYREAMRERPDLALVIRANKDLHFGVYGVTRMPTLVQMIETLWLQIGPVLNLDLRASPKRLRQVTAYRHHAELVTALRDHDSEAARAALTADITTAGDFILAHGDLPSQHSGDANG